MSMSKGQASMVDIVMLATAISFMLVFGTFMNSQQEINTEQMREWSIYTQAAFISASQYRGDFSSVIMGADDTSVVQIVSLAFCNSAIDRVKVESSIKDKIGSLMPSNYRYIYYVEETGSSDNSLNVNNFQQTVCAKEIPLASQQIFDKCSSGQISLTYQFGIWPEWKNYPATC